MGWSEVVFGTLVSIFSFHSPSENWAATSYNHILKSSSHWGHVSDFSSGSADKHTAIWHNSSSDRMNSGMNVDSNQIQEKKRVSLHKWGHLR